MNICFGVGRCILSEEYVPKSLHKPDPRNVRAGVRILQPSATEEGAFIPASDVYMSLTADDANNLAIYFAALRESLLGVCAPTEGQS